jgi:hypothetical protein
VAAAAAEAAAAAAEAAAAVADAALALAAEAALPLAAEAALALAAEAAELAGELVGELPAEAAARRGGLAAGARDGLPIALTNEGPYAGFDKSGPASSRVLRSAPARGQAPASAGSSARARSTMSWRMIGFEDTGRRVYDEHVIVLAEVLLELRVQQAALHTQAADANDHGVRGQRRQRPV